MHLTGTWWEVREGNEARGIIKSVKLSYDIHIHTQHSTPDTSRTILLYSHFICLLTLQSNSIYLVVLVRVMVETM